MAMGTRKQREKQEDLWIAHTELASAPGHPFYQRLNELLETDARTGKHLETATDPRGRVQSKPDPAPTVGRGHAAGVEEPLRQPCFDPLLTLPVSDK